jgi:hypothetical protein
MNKYRIIIEYSDSGTKKDHKFELSINANDDVEALKLAKIDFNKYESLVSASWVRIIKSYKIIHVKDD